MRNGVETRMDRGEHAQPDAKAAVTGQQRWPVVLTALFALAISVLLPERLILGPGWVVPAMLGIFAIVILATSPRLAGRRYLLLRALTIGMVVIFAAGAGYAAIHLVLDLIDGGKSWPTARALLVAGAVVWLNTNIAFALVYWELDGGGALNRARRPQPYPDLAFPQHLSPELAPPGWRPTFIDYLYLGFTNATAFSPTDVMPLRPWAKIAMGLQATISMAILTLVIANAVNLLG
ncbi:hypothetical protein Rhe02_16800 [Rhizocola hellebori]|uniref:DUF1345 domain-containing protein n=1 Tax=Rhizocola hellebori TaxID=1392758 RepID=A0A8J3VF63_9ACTN|nr:DUF1345 domain-containing protein [Rhizocola hellebori]GIH03613.1 hypothetical protein Rhe02_16800 [Rhizocola hellebori]